MHALPLILLAATHGIDVEGMDTKLPAGDDFNTYCSGTWLKNTEIPADQSAWGMNAVLSENARKDTADLIKTAGAADPQVAECYATFMDEAAIEARGATPLKPRLAELAAIADKKALATALGRELRSDTDALNATNFYTPHLFGLWVVQALDDPQHNVPYLMQGGLGLPDREYFVSTEKDMVALREKYEAHIATMLKLAGVPDSAAKSTRIVALEKKIAAAHVTRAESEEIKNVVAWKKDELAKNAPGLDWAAFLAGARLDAPAIWLWQPKAVTGLSALVASEPLDAWKDWLTFHYVDESAPFLSKAFVDAHFDFHRKAVAGVPQLSERWKRGSDFCSWALGEAVGKLYAQKYFPGEARAKAQLIVDALLKAFVKRIDAIKWMSPKTKAAAKEKVATLKVGVGYPDAWRDYSSLKIIKGDALGNAERADLFEYDRNLKKIGKAPDRGEWWMTPQTMDAVNLPLQNALNFPAAILQPPYFDPEADPAVNFAGMGATVGHEISHSFDDSGSQFDAQGKMINWWTSDDLKHFKEASEKLAAQYDKYEPLPGIHINGHQVLGENIADVAGLAAAFDAYKESLHGKPSVKSQGFTGEQQFFIAFGQSWREKRREASLKQQLITDGHAPEPYRCDTVRNIDGWYPAFNVKAGQKLFLAPAERVRVW